MTSFYWPQGRGPEEIAQEQAFERQQRLLEARQNMQQKFSGLLGTPKGASQAPQQGNQFISLLSMLLGLPQDDGGPPGIPQKLTTDRLGLYPPEGSPPGDWRRTTTGSPVTPWGGPRKTRVPIPEPFRPHPNMGAQLGPVTATPLATPDQGGQGTVTPAGPSGARRVVMPSTVGSSTVGSSTVGGGMKSGGSLR